jgi:D-alanyl-D-alanine dipeptidase
MAWLRFAALLLLVPPAQTFPQPIEDSCAVRRPDLVELVLLDSTIRLDIRYATANNFVGQPVYSQPRAFLQRPAALALLKAHRMLLEKGYGLLVFDGYRPWSVTKKFWEVTPAPLRKFVANPAKGSRHNRGCAVDLTLYDRRTGRPVPMPSAYDDFTDQASPWYEGGTEAERKMRDLLICVMEGEGFTVESSEWWHFDYKDWREYRILDIPFEKMN